jgi:hypothetical protein
MQGIKAVSQNYASVVISVLAMWLSEKSLKCSRRKPISLVTVDCMCSSPSLMGERKDDNKGRDFMRGLPYFLLGFTALVRS